jgi:hypothetical protein
MAVPCRFSRLSHAVNHRLIPASAKRMACAGWITPYHTTCGLNNENRRCKARNFTDGPAGLLDRAPGWDKIDGIHKIIGNGMKKIAAALLTGGGIPVFLPACAG